MKFWQYLRILVLLAAYIPGRCDIWFDPAVDEMIRKSEIIGVFKVINCCTQWSEVEPLNLLKGDVQRSIWIKRSLRYPEMDILCPGEKYMFFLNKDEYSRSNINYYNKKNPAADRAGILELNKIRRNIYQFPTPSCGRYPIIDDKVYIDITDINAVVSGLPIDEFEAFIKQVLRQSVDDDFINIIQQGILDGLKRRDPYYTSNCIAMLNFAGDQKFLPIFQDVVSDSIWQVRYVLARHLPKIKDSIATDLLVKLVFDTAGIVQRQAVMSFAESQPASFVGPILMEALKTASVKGLYRPTLPIWFSNSGGRNQIVYSLGDIGYKPALPVLFSFLDTKDEYLFFAALTAIKNIDAQSLIPYIKGRVLDPEIPEDVLQNLIRIVEDAKLVECKDILKQYMDLHQKNNSWARSIVFSCLVSLAETDTSVQHIILDDFRNFIINYDAFKSIDQIERSIQYIEACTSLGIRDSHSLVYELMYRWDGFDPATFHDKRMFLNKKQKEDSLKNRFNKLYRDAGNNSMDVIAFILPGGKAERYVIQAVLSATGDLSTENIKISQITNIPVENISLIDDSNACWPECQERFSRSLLDSYIEYVSAVYNKQDVKFLKSFLRQTQWGNRHYKRYTSRMVRSIADKLRQQSKE